MSEPRRGSVMVFDLLLPRPTVYDAHPFILVVLQAALARYFVSNARACMELTTIRHLRWLLLNGATEPQSLSSPQPPLLGSTAHSMSHSAT